MSENIPRLFLFNSEIHSCPGTEENNFLALPKIDNAVIPAGVHNFSTPDRPFSPVQSVDHRMKEAMKPPIEDTEVLRPKNFNALLDETQSMLAKELSQANAPEIKESLTSLISLLKENANLANLFQSYTNWLQKA